MALVLCLILHVVLSKVSGLDAEDWRKEIEKRLSSLEEFNVHLQKENANLRFIVSETQHENKLLKRELNKVVERVDKCEEAILTHDDIQRTLGRGTVTKESDDDLKIFSKGNRHSNPRRGERSMELVVSENENEVFTKWKGQPVPRIVPPDSYPVSAVAFYGYLSQNSAPNLPPHHLIVYDKVVINRANGYNKGDGIFIAPVTGVYAFHFSVCVFESPDIPWASLEIALNGNTLGSIFEEGAASGGGFHCSSTLVISDVHIGDHVFIRTMQTTIGHIHSDQRGRTSFSGWLLYR